ncbi:hypothetical protein SELMODRAFT_443385 [Selaginella moellendorffii]|uniref:Pollen Ole e 1 allergen and extensin family protein n=1 Tax=Selaginella moellendorffii TaxID=88036 RepID=D8S0X9_SELML|nr:uncharacterized protein LOC9638358 [Selaginella moellendorffii]EFJ22127.1 hypothetical protein SELMODRAFT_443385 [Selaginella moellendorffii]|eukprot:XP_002977017.1 uncharacterized protein LOC9638358 [Selaginella moellendorffii]
MAVPIFLSLKSSSPSGLLLAVVLVLALESHAVSLDARRFLRSSSSSSIRILFGTVYCDSCLEARLTRNSIVFSEAEIQIECVGSRGNPDHSTVVSTNETGQFQAQIPPQFDACSVQFLSKALDSCATPAAAFATSASLDQPRDLVFRPSQALAFCSTPARREALTLGPPEPPKKSTQGYKLDPPEPPRPRKFVVTTKAYHLGPPNPPQPRTANHN